MADYSTMIEIAASPETIFSYLVTERGMLTWMGQHARLDPHPGGRFEVDIAGFPVRGEYLEVDPPRRVTISWGHAGDDQLPPGSSRVTFELTPVTNGTRVELRHTGLPDESVDSHSDGWQHFLDRLGRAAVGDTPGTDDWVPLPLRS